jgi:5-methylcytosine-specific restriction protein A
VSNNPLRHLYASKRWKELRLRQLAKEPLCWMCQALDRITPATVVDHYIPHRGDVVLFWRADNLRSTCKCCHDGAKQQLERSGTLRGCDVNGYPLGRSDW